MLCHVKKENWCDYIREQGWAPGDILFYLGYDNPPVDVEKLAKQLSVKHNATIADPYMQRRMKVARWIGLKVLFGIEYGDKSINDIELYAASYFAEELMTPAYMVRRLAGKYNERVLSGIFGVSEKVVAQRLKEVYGGG